MSRAPAQRPGRTAAPVAVRRLALALPPRNKEDTGLLLPSLALPREVCLFARRDEQFTRDPPNANLHEHVLFVALRGSVDVTLDTLTVAVTPGDALLVFPRQYHRFSRPRPPLLWLVLVFKTESAAALDPLRNAVVPMAPPLWTHLAACLRAYLHPHRALPYVGAGLAVELWRLLAGCSTASRRPPAGGASAAPAWRRITGPISGRANSSWRTCTGRSAWARSPPPSASRPPACRHSSSSVSATRSATPSAGRAFIAPPN